jgi:hypothetical protein
MVIQFIALHLPRKTRNNNMKHIVLAFSLLLAAVTVTFAQNNGKAKAPAKPLTSTQETAARSTTEQLTSKYGLTPDQAKQMYTVQARKQRNLTEIEGFKTTDVKLYQAKLQSIQKGTLNSIRRILNSKEQVELFEKTQRDVRNQKAAKRKELIANKADAEAALLDIYAE